MSKRNSTSGTPNFENFSLIVPLADLVPFPSDAGEGLKRISHTLEFPIRANVDRHGFSEGFSTFTKLEGLDIDSHPLLYYDRSSSAGHLPNSIQYICVRGVMLFLELSSKFCLWLWGLVAAWCAKSVVY